MDDGPSEAAIDFIPAMCFVRRGIAKAQPEKVVLTAAELAKVIKDTKEELDSEEEDNDSENSENGHRNGGDEDAMETSDNENVNPEDEFNFENYDQEAGGQVAAISDVAVLDENAQEDNDDDDSEAEDEIIKPNDNLLLVGHVSDDAATMEVWVFNEEEESLYVHHDFMLPSFPLCVEWLNHDQGSDTPGNMCAVGCMDPVISVWDLDIQDSYEPAFKLGSKGSRKRNIPKYGHTDAVLTLSWNTHFTHILSSGSVDQTVILWDLDEGKPHTTIKAFKEKVQSIAFHPTEAQSLLTGCSDGKVRLFDCRDPDTVDSAFKKWKTGAEVEKVVWNPADSNFFLTGTNDGKLHYADLRAPQKFLWSHNAHSEEISGICFNHQVKDLLTTTASDGLLKIWKFNEQEIKEVYQHDFTLGRLQCMAQSPEDPFTLAIGGERPPRCRVYNIKNFEAVRRTFNLEPTMEMAE